MKIRFSALIVLFMAFGVLLFQTVFALPPATKYLPGETTSPTCAPGDTNCDVDLSSLDDQTLSFSGNLLVISGGNSLDLSSYLDNTDSQTLSFSGNLLVISGGNSVNLSPYLDNTDSQTLALSGSNLSISGGNSVSLASFMPTPINDNAASGYMDIGNMRIQWGSAISNSSVQNFNFPAPFASTSYSITANPMSSATTYLESVHISPSSTTQFSAIVMYVAGGSAAPNSGRAFSWQAIGQKP